MKKLAEIFEPSGWLLGGPEMQIKCDTCLRYPVQISRHGLGEHLAGSALVKLRSTLHSIAFIGKFSYVTQKCTQEAMEKKKSEFFIDCGRNARHGGEIHGDLPAENTKNEVEHEE